MSHNVLLVSAGIFHPPWLGRFWLRRTLNSLPNYQLRRVSSLEIILNLSLDSYEGMVLYIHHQKLSTPALDTLERYVRQGGGLLGIHSATASFKGEYRYFDMIGGQFMEHGPIQSFQVEQVGIVDEIFDHQEPFTVRDELYRHKYDPKVRVHFFATIDGEREPIVWTRPYGRGRVCYCSLGHRSATLRLPEVQNILRRGLQWALTGATDQVNTP